MNTSKKDESERGRPTKSGWEVPWKKEESAHQTGCEWGSNEAVQVRMGGLGGFYYEYRQEGRSREAASWAHLVYCKQTTSKSQSGQVEQRIIGLMFNDV